MELLNIDMLIDEDDEINNTNDNNNNNLDIDFPQYYNVSKKRKKRSQNKNKNMDIYEYRKVNEDENIFEHKIENKKYIFFVKWNGYQSGDNSWVTENDFKQKEINIEYFNQKNILYN